MEFLKTLEEAFAPAKFIDQAEKNTQAILAYVEPKELSKTLVNFVSDASDFARAQVSAFNSISTIAKTQVEELTKQFTKATASK
jgi:hypothetical protein